MRTDFIYIDDKSQIDTSKTTVYDMNKRYVDSKGNMYGLKYNRVTRKVEIIQLLRTSSDRADAIRSRMIENRRHARYSRSQDNDETSDENTELNEEDNITESGLNSNGNNTDQSVVYSYNNVSEDSSDDFDQPFHPDRFVDFLFSSVKLHRERFNTIISNINKSQIITHQDRHNHNEYEDLNRTLDIESYKKLEEITNIQKELVEYPRPVSYYVSRISRTAQRILQGIPDEKSKLHYILLCEVNDFFREIYKSFLSIIDRYQEIISQAGNTEEKIKVVQRKQFLADAQITLGNTKKEVQKILERLRTLDEYLNNTDNFIQ